MKKIVAILNKKYSRPIIVLIFILLFVIVNAINLRGSYLEYKELGENFIEIFYKDVKYTYSIMIISFLTIYTMFYMVNRGIKKGIKPFFEQDKISIPKLPNKSISLIVAAISSVVFINIFKEKILMFASNVSFQISDPVFSLDISYYMFIKPLIETFIMTFIVLVIITSVYRTLYNIIVFNVYCNGIDRELLKNSLLFKKLERNVILLAIGIASMTLINCQDVVLNPFITLKDQAQTELIGAGFTESTLKLYGEIIFSIVIVVAAIIGVKNFKKGQARKVIPAIAVIPGYLVVLFLILVGFDLIYVNKNELDQEGRFIKSNIEFTKNAYNINIDEVNLEYSGAVTISDIEKNTRVVNNIPLVSKDMVIATLQDSQTEKDIYKYNNVSIANYKIAGKDSIVYIAPREIKNDNIAYNYKTYQYTHGFGEIIASATETTDMGTLKYIQKDISGEDEVIKINNPRIYFGLETNDTIVTNSKNKSEYDYTDSKGNQYDYGYEGTAGLSLKFIDRFALAVKKGDLKLVFSNSVQSDSKILINRNIRKRAKAALPYLIYDENPYTVIDDDGNIYWVIDAYTTSSEYPYSQYVTIKYEGQNRKINYIRNSIKVIIDAYNGTMKFYITDRTDPIAMAYNKLYPDLFESKESSIPDSISNKFIYPQFLFDVQAKMLEIYHNVKPEILYRSTDIWKFATYNVSQTNKSVSMPIESYYTMCKENNKNKLGLVQIYSRESKSNIISYLVGTTNGNDKKLTLYKYSSDSGILGPTQLDKEIEQDENISKQLKELEITGAKISKKVYVIPLENTLLYVETIYQTMINDTNVPSLKKIIVASGTKMAIGDTLEEALENLLSNSAVNIKIDTTEDIDGIIQSIIQSNKNLKESSKNNNWEMMGNDIQELQKLIDSLELLTKEKKNEKNVDIVEDIIDSK